MDAVPDLRNDARHATADDLRTAPSPPPTSLTERRDRAITEDVEDVLNNHRGLHDCPISTAVRGGVAHVQGTVRSEEERQLARRVIGRVRGVQAVWDVLRLPGEGQPKVIDIGCGRKKQHPWAIGVDCHPFDGVEVVADLEKGLPFGDREIDQVYAVHFLEHVHNLIGLMNEIHRVLKPGGVLHAMVPHRDSVNAWADPTHVRFFHQQTIKAFCCESPFVRPFRPLAVTTADGNVVADLQPVQPDEPPPSPIELARFFD